MENVFEQKRCKQCGWELGWFSRQKFCSEPCASTWVRNEMEYEQHKKEKLINELDAIREMRDKQKYEALKGKFEEGERVEMSEKPSFSDPHNENKKLEIRPNPKESFGRKTPTTTPRPPAPPTRRIKKDNEYYEELIESSNRYHNDVYEYIDENGADEEFQAYFQGEYHWLKSVATRNRFKLDE